MPNIFDIEQGTDEWFALRRGVITATRAQALFERGQSKAGGKFSYTARHKEKRVEAIAEIAMERLKHSGKPRITGAALRRGNDFEDEAIDAYTFYTGNIVENCGFMLHSIVEGVGCSPDGLIGDDGMVQIKVPTSVKKHVEYLQFKTHASEYGWQLFHEMFTAERKWTDIVSYCPEAPEYLQLATHRVFAPKSWGEYRKMLLEAEKEIEQKVASLSAIKSAA